MGPVAAAPAPSGLEGLLAGMGGGEEEAQPAM